MLGRGALSLVGGPAACVLLVVVASACALGRRATFERPSAELQAIQVTGIGLSGGSLVLRLDISNPNRYEIRATRVAARLDLEATPFGETRVERRVVLPAESTVPVDLPVSFTWEGVGAGARALLARGAVDFTLITQIDVDTPIGERRIELESAGLVPLRDLIR